MEIFASTETIVATLLLYLCDLVEKYKSMKKANLSGFILDIQTMLFLLDLKYEKSLYKT